MKLKIYMKHDQYQKEIMIQMLIQILCNNSDKQLGKIYLERIEK